MRWIVISMFAVLFMAQPARAEQPYFGYSEVPTLDGQRAHVTDPKTGGPGGEGICFVWQRGWRVSRGYMNIEAQRVTRWYTGWAFRIDPRQQAATLSNFSAPTIEETPQGRRRVGPDRTVPRLTVTVPLTTTRPPDPNYCKEHAPSRPGQPNAQNFYKCWAYQHGATEEELNPRVDGLVNEAPYSLYPPDEGHPCTVGDGVHGYRQGWIRGGFCQVN